MALVSGACYGQPVYVEAPDGEALPYGLFSIANIVEAGNGKWQQGVEWEPASCGNAGTYACPTCTQNDEGTAPAKDYEEGVGLSLALPFTVYGSFYCSPIGNWDRAEQFARDRLANGAERAVELQLYTGSHITSQALTDAATVNITPTVGTPVSIAQGIALAEQYIGANGNGLGSIIMTRREATLANAQGVTIAPRNGGDYLMTSLGTPVAAVGGFDGRTGPNGIVPVAGQAWIYALGSRPRIWRSDVFLTSGREQSLNTSNNDLKILAEQTYALGWDCFAAAVLVTSI